MYELPMLEGSLILKGGVGKQSQLECCCDNTWLTVVVHVHMENRTCSTPDVT